MPLQRPAILLIAHGSRRPEANAELEQVAARLREQSHYELVQPAYLELAEPNIEQGAARCVASRASVVILLPYFLSPGRHVVDDLTAACDRLRQRYPAVSFVLAPPLGQHPAVVDILLQHARIAEQQLNASPPFPQIDTRVMAETENKKRADRISASGATSTSS